MFLQDSSKQKRLEVESPRESENWELRCVKEISYHVLFLRAVGKPRRALHGSCQRTPPRQGQGRHPSHCTALKQPMRGLQIKSLCSGASSITGACFHTHTHPQELLPGCPAHQATSARPKSALCSSCAPALCISAPCNASSCFLEENQQPQRGFWLKVRQEHVAQALILSFV